MQTPIRLASALALLSLGALLWLGAPAMADEPFQVDTASRLSYPLRGLSDHFAIAVNFDSGRYALSSVAMLATSNGPGGAPLLPNEDVTVTLTTDAGPGRALLEIKPRTDSFRFPGEYRVALVLSGRTLDGSSRPVNSAATLSITRLEPQIDIEGLSGKSTTLYRLFPWMAASGAIQYPLQSVKPSDAAELSVSSLGLDWVTTQELVPNALITVSPSHLNLIAEKPQNVVVRFSGLDYAGDFETRLAFDSDSFSKRHTVTIAVHVKDSPWMPLAVILLGVIGGAAVTWMSGDRRNTLRARYRLSELRLRLQKLAPAIVLPATAERYRRISGKLADIERASHIERTAEAELTAITNDVESMEALLATTRADVAGKLDHLDVQIAALHAALLPDVPDIDERTRPVSARIAAIRAMNRGGQYEYAAQQAAAAEKMFNLVSRDAREAAISDISLQLAAKSSSGADQRITVKLVELRRMATMAPTDEFMTALKSLHQDMHGLGIAAQARPGAVPDRAPARRPDYDIRVLTADRSRITGQLIDMTVDVENGKPLPDRIVWNFGNGALDAVSGERSASTAYDWPGPYTVSVQLYRDADVNFHETATASLTIKAGSAARQVVRAVGALVRNEILIVSLAILLAAVTGLLQLYADKSFGSVDDYLAALLWGFGVEKAIRGFNAVYSSLDKSS